MNLQSIIVSLVVMALIVFVSAPLHILTRKLSFKETFTDKRFWAYTISISIFLGILVSLYG
jgi:hypothetical protein